ncbi:MAG: hypothetical protein AAF266_01515 [Planctomycetota bacterium]
MRQQVQRHFGFLKTTLLGGIVFLLPIAVVLWLVVQAGQVLYAGYVAADQYLSDHKEELASYGDLGTFEYVTLGCATLVLLIGICFAAGMLARRSIGRWFSDRAERYLAMLFPRYVVFKDQLTGNLGSASLRPVLTRIGPATRIGMEVERDAEGRVVVYLPSSPDPWSGTVQIVEPDDVSPLRGEFADVMATFEQLGRGTGRFVDRSKAFATEKHGKSKPAAEADG